LHKIEESKKVKKAKIFLCGKKKRVQPITQPVVHAQMETGKYMNCEIKK
jgi:hypothetical protein